MEYSYDAILLYKTVGVLRKTANIAPAANLPEMEQDDSRYKTTHSINAINHMASVCLVTYIFIQVKEESCCYRTARFLTELSQKVIHSLSL